ncbi:MAG TPA: MotA/TolQ/ExbB proton channel family protein, partial [Isosphaeraceae bacterium]|nr:MotA/TolQ/ExbB proton channel family protein [Isosphaeraceae bacterium]
APAAAAPAEAAAEAPKATSFLWYAINASGTIGGVLLLLSIYMTAVVIRLFMEFRVNDAVPPPLVEKLEEAIKERKFQEAYDACREDNSFLARMVRTGVANLPNGRPEAKEAMNATSEEVVVSMESKVSYLAVIGTLGPMLGLLGTVWGMILAFQSISTSGAQPRPDQLAGNIATALFTTLEGVIVAVPAIFFFAMFRNRISIISVETAKVAERTINAFWTAAKQQPGGAKAPA